MIGILKEICAIPTAPGMENGILDHIEKNHAKDLECSYDGMGNLTVIKRCGKENAKKLLLCAKTDAEGLIVNYIEENGYLRVTKLGSPSAVSMAYTKVISDKGVCGYVVPEKGADIKDADIAKLYVDIGASSRKDAEKVVSPGDVLAAEPSVCEITCGRSGGNGAASRLGVAILIDILDNVKADNADIYFSFTVQGSLMNRGAKTASFDIQPDRCICVDICESFDTIGANKRGEAVLGDGAVILAKTADFCADPLLRENAENTAKKNDIKYKTCVYPEKTTAASFLSSCGKGVQTCVVAVPARNIGSGAEIFDMKDAENVSKLICAMINE